jgi:hypothetical protein
MLGIVDEGLYSEADIQAIRQRLGAIQGRIRSRGEQLRELEAVAPVVVETQGGTA